MKYFFTLIILLTLASPMLQAQAMTTKQQQQLCIDLDYEFRTKIISKQFGDDAIAPMQAGYTFVSYLRDAYYAKGKNHTSFYSKQTEAGELLRIGEGSFKEEKAYDNKLKRWYILPRDIQETAYFFLNDKLICISQCLGSTDYNSAPSVYWISVSIADFYYKDLKIIKKKYYHKYDMIGMASGNMRFNEHTYSDEEKHFKEAWDNNEPQLKEKALSLLKEYKQ